MSLLLVISHTQGRLGPHHISTSCILFEVASFSVASCGRSVLPVFGSSSGRVAVHLVVVSVSGWNKKSSVSSYCTILLNCVHLPLYLATGTENQPEIAYTKRKLERLMVSKGSNSWIQGQECCQWLSISALLVPFLPLFICLYFFQPHDDKYIPQILNFTCYWQVQPSGKNDLSLRSKSKYPVKKLCWPWLDLCPPLEQ